MSPSPSAVPSPAMSPAAVLMSPTTSAPRPAPTATRTSKSPSPKPDCHPNYSVCLPRVTDLDCTEIPHKNFRVIGGRDPYKLDRDDDGIACESN